MSFIATANPPLADAEGTIQNDGFFPAVDVATLREAIRLDGTVTPMRLRQAILAAMVSVNAELLSYQAAAIAGGRATMAGMPCPQIGGSSQHTTLYLRAVYAHVQADLAEAYRDIDTTPHSEGKSDRIKARIDGQTDEHRRTMRWAISDILGIRRTTVELI